MPSGVPGAWGAEMQLFWQASTIMVLGMGLVFLFLLVVILAVQLTAVLVRRFAPADGAASTEAPVAAAPGDELLAAVMAVALHQAGSPQAPVKQSSKPATAGK